MAPIDELVAVWNLTSEFPLHRARVLSSTFSKGASTYVQLSSGLLEVYKSDPKESLINNALLTIVVGIRLGLSTEAEVQEAVDALLARPLAKPDADSILNDVVEKLMQQRKMQ